MGEELSPAGWVSPGRARASWGRSWLWNEEDGGLCTLRRLAEGVAGL